MNKLGLYFNLNAAALSQSTENELNEKLTNNINSRSKFRRSNDSNTRKLKNDLIEAAVKAERTFRLQVVYDPINQCQKRLSEPTVDDIEDEMRLIGPFANGDGVVQKDVKLFAYSGW